MLKMKKKSSTNLNSICDAYTIHLYTIQGVAQLLPSEYITDYLDLAKNI